MIGFAQVMPESLRLSVRSKDGDRDAIERASENAIHARLAAARASGAVDWIMGYRARGLKALAAAEFKLAKLAEN